MTHYLGLPDLPDEQRQALRKAKRLEWISIGYMITVIAAMLFAMGSSQAMKAALFEDVLSLIPPIAFLYAVHRARRGPDVDFPYGHHRVIGSAHLVASFALLAMGVLLVKESVTTLISGEHPTVGTVQVFGYTFWAGWLMIAVSVYAGVGPVILGRLKQQPAQDLHDKVLYADADMNKADWQTAGATILGVIGIGMGLWWADSAAALIIAVSIVYDGVVNLRNAMRGLVDSRARTYDDSEVHPVIGRAGEVLRSLDWVVDADVRVRDQGHVFHVEAFVVPQDRETVRLADLAAARERIEDLDWKLHDVVVIPVDSLPRAQVPAEE